MDRETKMLHMKVKATDITTSDDGQQFGQLDCYAAVFNVIDDGNDRILPNAFSRTIKNSKSRAQAREKKYLLPMLWNHSTDDLIGGWYSLAEDDYGLRCKGDINLQIQRGREYWELAKAGMSDTFSIVYDVMPQGSKYTKDGVRELSELRLFTCDPVPLPMCEDTRLIGVKLMEEKTACGSTSGPIGPRDESWDGGAAKSWIWSKALDDDGNVKPAIAKKYFMRVDGDAKLKGSYGYPFWTHDHISVGGVKAIAGALQGSRGADAGGDTAGMKAKVKRLYSRINSKYPDDTPLKVPWEDDDGKGNSGLYQLKTLLDHYNREMADDLLEDWQDVYLTSLTCAVMDALKDGDETDISTALDDFKTLVMGTFVTQANDVDLQGYLEDNAISYSPADYTMQYGSESKPNYGYGYMSRRTRQSRKEMLSGDATTGGFFASDKADGANMGPIIVTKSNVDKAMKAITTHVEALHNAADEVTTLIGGNDQLTPTEKRALPFKAGRSFSTSNAQALSDHADTLHDLADSHGKAMKRHLKAINSAADDLATILQGSEAAYGTDPGTPDDDQQEGKTRSSRKTPSPTPRSSNADTVREEDIELALSRLHAITR